MMPTSQQMSATARSYSMRQRLDLVFGILLVFLAVGGSIALELTQRQRKDAALLAALHEQLCRGDKSLVGNKGYRKYLTTTGPHFDIDWDKAEADARFDGLWVLRTDLAVEAAEVALKYKSSGKC